MHIIRIIILLTLLSLFGTISGPALSAGQAQITFQVDMSSELKSGYFNPEQQKLVIRGNIGPLSKYETMELSPQKSDPTIYQITLRFPEDFVGMELDYQFLITSGKMIMKEDFERSVRIRDDTIQIAALPFYSFEL